jgi:L-lactate dehydrogenase (cytochrome)
LDGTQSTAAVLPDIAAAMRGDLTLFVDSGVRTGLDIVRMLALGADGVLLGRSYIYALAAAGKQGVGHLLDLLEKDMRTTMVLAGAKTLRDISREMLVR